MFKSGIGHGGGGLTDSTIKMVDEAIALSQQGPEAIKAITQATGLIGYDLEAPAKFLVPLISPLRNKFPRLKGPTGTGANWRAFTSLTNTNATAGTPNKLGVSEGNRNRVMAETVTSYLANYKSLGMENNVTFEATYAGENFDQPQARMVKNLLKLFIKEEEHVLLGGNNTLALNPSGATTTPTCGDVAGGGTLLHDTTYSVIVVPLTYDGLRFGTVSATGIYQTYSRTNADSSVDATIQGFCGRKSANQTQYCANDGVDDHCVSAYTPVVNGAMGYAWYISSTVGQERLVAITTINSVLITAAPAGTNQLASALADTDTSVDPLLFDGALALTMGAGQTNPAGTTSGGFVTHFATGTPGTGTTFTTDGVAGIPEIDATLESMFTTYQLGPKTIWVSAPAIKKLTQLSLGAAGAPLLRYFQDVNAVAKGVIDMGMVIGNYLNKFTQSYIAFRVHPFMPQSTVWMETEQLPNGIYPENDVESVLAVRCRRDMYEIDWPLRSRKYEAGVYSDEVLQLYAGFSLAVIDNVGGLS
jgi:hypothetical protein